MENNETGKILDPELLFWFAPAVFYVFSVLQNQGINFVLENPMVFKDMAITLFLAFFAITFNFIYNYYPITYLIKGRKASK